MDRRRTGRMSHWSERRILVSHCADASTLGGCAPCIAVLDSPHLSLICDVLSAVLAEAACGRWLATGVTGWQPHAACTGERCCISHCSVADSLSSPFLFLPLCSEYQAPLECKVYEACLGVPQTGDSTPARRASPVSMQRIRAVKATVVCDVSSAPLAIMPCYIAATAARRRIRRRRSSPQCW